MLLEELIYGLQLTAIGMGVVFLALSVVSIIISLFDRFGREKQPVAEQSQTAPVVAEPETGEILPEVIAVISAAVAEAVGKKARVTHIRQSVSSTAWQRQGRATIMASHVTKR